MGYVLPAWAMRVLLLGAGASKPAGYPLSTELLPTMERLSASGDSTQNFRVAWQGWEELRDRTRGFFKILLTNPNPEIIFSILDLLEAAEDSELMSALEGRSLADIRAEDTSRFDQYRATAETEGLSEISVARARLLECLHWYFDFMHHEDGTDRGRAKRAYLRSLLSRLHPGDIVMTLNWDTTVERTLAGMGRWNPTTGYGFKRPLRMVPRGHHDPLEGGKAADAVTLPSEIVVLKLHGSFGWYHRTRDQLYFDQPYYLDAFGFELDGRPIAFRDPDHRDLGPPLDPLLLYPSFLKQLQGAEMQTIWQAAVEALGQAEQVEIYGYSLPPSDTAIRVLLNCLRFRLDRKAVNAAVHNPNPPSQLRWRELLGDNAEIDSVKLGEP